MNEIKKFREQLGLNQEHLAIYLGIERGLLSMVEIGKRELPADALIKLNLLEQNFTKNNLPDNVSLIATELTRQENSLQLFLQHQPQLLLQEVSHLQKQLTAMKANYKIAMQLLQLTRTMRQQMPLQDATDFQNQKDILWLATTEAIAIEKINTNNLVKQKRLELKIEGLELQMRNV